jgi:hypothetical protein
MFNILVDADASPVKQEVFRVANRYGIKVVLVANSTIKVPPEEWLEIVVVSSQLDATPSVNFPDRWSVFNITETRSPGLISMRFVPLIL